MVHNAFNPYLVSRELKEKEEDKAPAEKYVSAVGKPEVAYNEKDRGWTFTVQALGSAEDHGEHLRIED